MNEKPLKHDTFWYVVSFAAVAGLSLGGFLGAIATKEHGRTDPVVRYELRIIHESAPVVFQGKRSQPGVLSPGTLQTIELQSSRELFMGNSRDPFERRFVK